jgi:hypothetical protein
MRSVLTIGLCLAGLGLIGCGNSLPDPVVPSAPPPKAGPHGGLAYALPDELGYAEIVNEPPVEGRGEKVSTSIVVYFLSPDVKQSGKTPSDVKFILKRGKTDSRTLTLKAEPKSGDSSGQSRFVSESGPFRVEDLRGDLTASVEGKPVSISVVGGR